MPQAGVEFVGKLLGADELRDQFADVGFVRLDGAFSAEQAGAIRDTVWRHVERRSGVRPSTPSTWPAGWLPVSFKALKGRAVFAPLTDNPSVGAALDAIFAPGGWQHPSKPGAQVLLTMPTGGPWVLPAAWHMDCGFEQATWPVPAVKLFSFFDEVQAEGGGTLLLAGSHRLVERYTRRLPPGTPGNTTTWGRFMKQDPWTAQLHRGGTVAEPSRHLLGVTHTVDRIDVQAIELTGRPGDVVITHLHVFRCAAPNVGDRPRQMLGRTVTATPTS